MNPTTTTELVSKHPAHNKEHSSRLATLLASNMSMMKEMVSCKNENQILRDELDIERTRTATGDAEREDLNLQRIMVLEKQNRDLVAQLDGLENLNLELQSQGVYIDQLERKLEQLSTQN